MPRTRPARQCPNRQPRPRLRHTQMSRQYSPQPSRRLRQLIAHRLLRLRPVRQVGAPKLFPHPLEKLLLLEILAGMNSRKWFRWQWALLPVYWATIVVVFKTTLPVPVLDKIWVFSRISTFCAALGTL